jgi:hypothetical protein
MLTTWLLLPQKLALTSPKRDGLSMGIVRSRTQSTESSFLFFCLFPEYGCNCRRLHWDCLKRTLLYERDWLAGYFASKNSEKWSVAGDTVNSLLSLRTRRQEPLSGLLWREETPLRKRAIVCYQIACQEQSCQWHTVCFHLIRIEARDSETTAMRIQNANFFVILFYSQSVVVHSANCVKTCIQWHVEECSLALLCN